MRARKIRTLRIGVGDSATLPIALAKGERIVRCASSNSAVVECRVSNGAAVVTAVAEGSAAVTVLISCRGRPNRQVAFAIRAVEEDEE